MRAALLVCLLAACTTSSAPSPDLAARKVVTPVPPHDLRGVFWKQWKIEGGIDQSKGPGTFDVARTTLFHQLYAQPINTIVVDINEEPEDQHRAAIADFLEAFYRDQVATFGTPRIHVLFHFRRYFADQVEIELVAGYLEKLLEHVDETDPDIETILDGVRWGENGDADMTLHLQHALAFARAINAATDGWLRTRSYIINGLRLGALFVDLREADAALSFTDKIAPEVRYFSWAYKHFYLEVDGHASNPDPDAVGVAAVFATFATERGLDPDDPASWRAFFDAKLGFRALGGWLEDHASRPNLANLIYIGDSGDGANQTSSAALAAIQDMLADHGQAGFVFMIPFGLAGDPYYKPTTTLYTVAADRSSITPTSGLSLWRSFL